MERRTFLTSLAAAAASFFLPETPRKARITYQGAGKAVVLDNSWDFKVLGGSGRLYASVQQAIDGEIGEGPQNIRLTLLDDVKEDVDLSHLDFRKDSLTIKPFDRRAYATQGS